MFKHDIMVLDLEMTGIDPAKHEITQIAAVILDRKTLKEKKVFNQFIVPTKWKTAQKEALKVSGHTLAQLKEVGVPLHTALKNFTAFAGVKKVTHAGWTGSLDKAMLEQAFYKTGLSNPLDYHLVDIWVLGYMYAMQHTALRNKKRFEGFDMDELTASFKVQNQGVRHDALADCRYAAEIFRHLIKRIKFRK